MKAYIKDGVVVGIYTTEPHAPKDCTVVELSGRTDVPLLGWLYNSKKDKFIQPERTPLPELLLSDLVEPALELIDMEAAEVYNKVIGKMPNKLSLYTAKYQDAKAYKLQVYGDKLDNYRWIASEVSATGNKAEAVADIFISKYTALVAILTQVEEFRVYGKAMIRAAKSIEEVREARIQSVSEIRKLAE